MKPTEFIVENSIIAQEADDMHRDHEVQMARSQMYSAAQAAIEIHRLLRDVSEMEGLEGWVQSKLTLASQYLESVRDYMKYEAVSQEPEMMAFAESAADYALDQLLVEDDYDDAVKDFLAKGGQVQKGKTHKPRKSERLGGSRHIGGGGEKMKSSRTGISSKPTGRAVAGQASLGEQDMAEGQQLSEMATGGASSAGAVATSMSGPGHKPSSGVPKKIGNSYKSKKVTVGKGIY